MRGLFEKSIDHLAALECLALTALEWDHVLGWRHEGALAVHVNFGEQLSGGLVRSIVTSLQLLPTRARINLDYFFFGLRADGLGVKAPRSIIFLGMEFLVGILDHSWRFRSLLEDFEAKILYFDFLYLLLHRVLMLLIGSLQGYLAYNV